MQGDPEDPMDDEEFQDKFKDDKIICVVCGMEFQDNTSCFAHFSNVHFLRVEVEEVASLLLKLNEKVNLSNFYPPDDSTEEGDGPSTSP